MRVLVACEESQVVTIAFRKRGHEAYSCDIIPCSGGHPEWHIQDDCLKHLDDGWDIILAFPPCTHICVSGARWFEQKRKDGRQQQGIDFFMKFTNLKCPKVAIENPVGIMSRIYRKFDQIIQPYYFGDKAQKTTCLWLKGLPPLQHQAEPDLFTNKITHTDKGEMYISKSGKVIPKWYALLRADKNRATIRSKTFQGIANAMADQWG